MAKFMIAYTHAELDEITHVGPFDTATDACAYIDAADLDDDSPFCCLEAAVQVIYSPEIKGVHHG